MSNEVVTFRIETDIFRRQMAAFAKKKDQEFRRIIVDATLTLKKLAKEKVRNLTRGSKVRSGFLINNINTIIRDGGLTGEVLSGASYSQAYEEGTRPHHIRISNKQVLAGPLRGAPAGWEVSKKSKQMGYATYGKTVQHPGTHPHPFMYPAWKFACMKIESAIKQIF